MAKATTVKAGSVVVQVESDTPGTYIAICGITKREFSFEKALNEFESPDCTDLDKAAVVERAVKSITSSGSLSGVAAKESFATLIGYMQDGDSRNMRIRLVGFGSGVGTPDLQVSGKYHFKSLKLQSDMASLAEVSLSLESDGEWTTASVAALP